MIKLIKIYNLNHYSEDNAYINANFISSIDEKNCGNIYLIKMNNGSTYETDKDSFEKIMEVISND